MAEDSKRIVETENPGVPENHKPVDAMAVLMKHELDENTPKKHGRENWLAAKPMEHLLQTYYHTGKLQLALKELELLRADDDSSRHERQFQEERVKEYAADVANHAMMVLDTLGLLGVPKPKSVKNNPKPARAPIGSSDPGY